MVMRMMPRGAVVAVLVRQGLSSGRRWRLIEERTAAVLGRRPPGWAVGRSSAASAIGHGQGGDERGGGAGAFLGEDVERVLCRGEGVRG